MDATDPTLCAPFQGLDPARRRPGRISLPAGVRRRDRCKTRATPSEPVSLHAATTYPPLSDTSPGQRLSTHHATEQTRRRATTDGMLQAGGGATCRPISADEVAIDRQLARRRPSDQPYHVAPQLGIGRIVSDLDRRYVVRHVEGTYGTSYTGATGRRADWEARR